MTTVVQKQSLTGRDRILSDVAVVESVAAIACACLWTLGEASLAQFGFVCVLVCLLALWIRGAPTVAILLTAALNAAVLASGSRDVPGIFAIVFLAGVGGTIAIAVWGIVKRAGRSSLILVVLATAGVATAVSAGRPVGDPVEFISLAWPPVVGGAVLIGGSMEWLFRSHRSPAGDTDSGKDTEP